MIRQPEGARRTRCGECGYTYGTHGEQCSKAHSYHNCISTGAPRGGFGAAVDSCTERSDGTLWAGNDEYATQVNFCPFCGYSARVRLTDTQHKRSDWRC